MVERFNIARGLTIPIAGDAEQRLDAKSVRHVAIVASDYLGLRPTLLVSEGESVNLGQPIMIDKQTEGLVFVAPAGGKVLAIHRGAKRKLLSIVIELAEREESVKYPIYNSAQVSGLKRDEVTERILSAGLWASFRTRPFSKIPSPSTVPHAIFVNAMDTNPLAVDPGTVIRDAKEDFATGLEIVTKLSDDDVFVCRPPGSDVPGEDIPRVRVAEFRGPHPSGLVGTHMHYLKPASPARINWHLNYQDVIAIGRVFLQGKLDPVRIVSLAGPAVKRPRIIRTRLGASLAELTCDELQGSNNRVVSGSVLSGRQIEENAGFLGRYHLQVSCIPEGNQREWLGWQMPGFDKFSITRAFASAWSGRNKFAMTTSTGGSTRAMVPIGTYEKVVPLDILPTPLLRALITRDTTTAQELGCLELDEEDLGLCTFVCPGKYDYGSILRDNLERIEKEG